MIYWGAVLHLPTADHRIAPLPLKPQPRKSSVVRCFSQQSPVSYQFSVIPEAQGWHWVQAIPFPDYQVMNIKEFQADIREEVSDIDYERAQDILVARKFYNWLYSSKPSEQEGRLLLEALESEAPNLATIISVARRYLKNQANIS
jgi:hypothetical protein